jgi:type IV pilus assembly protein PilC
MPSGTDLSRLAHDLAPMLAAGWALPRSLEAVAKQTHDRRIALALPMVAGEIQKGIGVEDAFMNHRSAFGPLFCSIMRLYDASPATFPGLLSHLSDYFEKNESFRDRIIRTVKYPALIAIGSLGIIFAMLVYFLPPMLARASASSMILPPLSRVIYRCVSWIALHPQVEIGLVAVLLLPATLAWYLNSMLRPISNLLESIPLLCDLVRKERLRRFSLALASLLAGGVAIGEAITIAAETIRGTPLHEKLHAGLPEEPKSIASLAANLRRSAGYSELIFNFFTDAQARHSESDLCRKISEFYQEEIETSLTAVSLIIEPVIIVLAGLIGAAILFSLYLPATRFVGK